MGSKKVSFQPHQPGVYRDEPDRDDAASTSSAVLLDDIDDIDDEDLPSYSDSHPYTDESPSTADPAASNAETLVQPRSGESTYNPYVLHSSATSITDQFATGFLPNCLSQPTMWTGRKSAPSFRITATKPRGCTPCSSSSLRSHLATSSSWLERIPRPCGKIIKRPRTRSGTSGLRSISPPFLAAAKSNACQTTREDIAGEGFQS
jgi:hypothetical protein